MTSVLPHPSRTPDAPTIAGATAPRLLVPVFALTIFTSATLLFVVQPMFTKMVLPLLGGSAAVWNTCMLFFQVVLLAGYLYAHLGPHWLGVRRHALLHVVLLVASLAALPIGLARGATPPATENPIPWLLALLTVSLGAPFFLLSSTAPLLQKWFAQTDHPAAHNPYFLYSASNLGSLLALLSYPFLIEPSLRLARQSGWWAVGYGLLVGLIGGCAVLMYRAHARGRPAESDMGFAASPSGVGQAAPSAATRLRWVLLALVPSSLLLGVTTYLTTDIAAVPLLWVVPLALYLLTFALVFARRQVVPHSVMLFWQPFLLVPLLVLLVWGMTATSLWAFPVHLVAFFVTAMVCHGELVASRPPAAYVTQFYLWISVGGALGGVFNALVAPAVFSSVLEYPLMLAVACALRPWRMGDTFGRSSGVRGAIMLLLSVAALVAVLLIGRSLAPPLPPKAIWSAAVLLSGTVGILCYRLKDQPYSFGVSAVALVAAGLVTATWRTGELLAERNFYGVRSVQQVGSYRVLRHGTTRHGAQSTEPSRQREPLTYFSVEGPLGDVFRNLPPVAAPRRVAILGLGTGTIAAYSNPGEQWTYYEIDPGIERVARDPRYFTYLRDAPAALRVILGDGRLSLGRAPSGGYDLIILDAFSSDAVPVHLLTREAGTLYFDKLTPGGLLVFNLSNRYLTLEPVLSGLVRHAGGAALIKAANPTPEQAASQKHASIWAVVAREAGALGALKATRGWRALRSRGDVRGWTDDYSDLVSILGQP